MHFCIFTGAGASICEHKTEKSQYIKCGGSQICEHKRRRSKCKECKGGSICEHNRLRSNCKDCGGSQICEHGRVRCKCKECGRACVCEHNRLRSKCKECCGASICEHGRDKYFCKDCGGNGICEHNRVRSQCKDCKGTSVCEHNRIRSSCKDCGGSQICEHKRVRCRCKDCLGNSFCEHKILRNTCHICSPTSSRICQLCHMFQVSQYKPYCFGCYFHLHPDEQKATHRLEKEQKIVKEIQDILLPFSPVFNKLIPNKDGFNYRPDIFIELDTHVLVIEIDEEQHKQYSPICEFVRTNNIVFSQTKPTVFIRFNPDRYKKKINKAKISIKGCFTPTCLIRKEIYNERIKSLKESISYHLTHIPQQPMTCVLLFYDEY